MSFFPHSQGLGWNLELVFCVLVITAQRLLLPARKEGESEESED